ncbi:hypothetical protein C8Q77DRAFT_1153627 [Trametes polyzona]|nr:hypothetical protein C8Q77DRAFT_1153627 [Trametes polyzona]
MFSLRQCVRTTLVRSCRPHQSRFKSSAAATDSTKSSTAETDSTGIPLKATWSVNELLSSYPRPTISPATLKRLHELSALIPPEEGTKEHSRLTREVEDLVKLVEAVKLVDVSEAVDDAQHVVPDGRIWAEGEGIDLDAAPLTESDGSESAHGTALLKHASRTLEGLYVVEADKPRN